MTETSQIVLGCRASVSPAIAHTNGQAAMPTRPAQGFRARTVSGGHGQAGAPMTESLLVLLRASGPADGGGRPVLKPLWAQEAMHRAFALARLAHARSATAPGGRRAQFAAALDYALAKDLAAAYRSLHQAAEEEVVPCSRAVRIIVTDLVAMFGSDVALTTEIERLHLPAYKRRALGFAASELIVNALTHAFRGRRAGRIEVRLQATGHHRARLRIADDGVGFAGCSPAGGAGIAHSLAGLLEADLRYGATDGWATTADITFPLACQGIGRNGPVHG